MIAMLADRPHALHMRGEESGPGLRPLQRSHTPTDTNRHSEEMPTFFSLIPSVLRAPNTCTPDVFFPSPLIWPADGECSLHYTQPSLHTHRYTLKTPGAAFWKIVTRTEKERKKTKNRSETLSGKEDSGESVFPFSCTKRKILKPSGLREHIPLCARACMHACDRLRIVQHFIVFVGRLERE